MAFLGNKNSHKLTIKLGLLLVCVFMIIGIVPTLIQGIVLIESENNLLIEDRKLEVQNQCLVLANSMSRNSYFLKTEGTDNSIIDAEIETVADAYSGRIVIIDKNYKVIKDTFNLAVGRTNIAAEILNCFEGQNSNTYNKEKQYIIQTIPIYNSTQEAESKERTVVDGVLLIASSTENIDAIIDASRNRAKIYIALTVILILVLGMVIAKYIMNPFYRLSASMDKVAQGDLNAKVDERTYQITQKISDSINSSIERLRVMDQSRDEFVSNVSHELKTPITSIRVLADSLMGMDNATPELYKEFLQDISDEIDRESKIIDDLLELVKLDKDHVVLVTKSVDINTLLEQILKRLRPIAGKRNIEITYESIREVNAEVDETKFSLAISNIVENAIKYNKDAGSVHVTLDADHQFFYIKVEDTGVGISEEFQSLIFDRFYRVDKARSRATGGTGLGLSIARNIIMMHHGIIKVSSTEGEGSTFTIRTPLNYIEELQA